jgi:hypothetical protein
MKNPRMSYKVASKSFGEVSNTKVTPRMKVLYHTEEARKELKKKDTDWNAVRWHQREATRYAKVKSYLIPVRGDY